MNLTRVRYVAGIAIALVVAALLAVIGLSLYRGIEPTAPSVVGLLAFVGTLIGLLANLFSTQTIAVRLGGVQGQVAEVKDQVTDVQEKVNGHLKQHLGHTDEQVVRLVDERLDERLPRPPDAGSASG